MKFLYKPFAMIAALFFARVGRSIFKALWSAVDEGDPPQPTSRNASLPKVMAAAALEASTMAGASAVAERVSARTFHHLTGYWPEEETDSPK